MHDPDIVGITTAGTRVIPILLKCSSLLLQDVTIFMTINVNPSMNHTPLDILADKYWKEMDDALTDEERFPRLNRVTLLLRVGIVGGDRDFSLEIGEIMKKCLRKVNAKRILEVIMSVCLQIPREFYDTNYRYDCGLGFTALSNGSNGGDRPHKRGEILRNGFDPDVVYGLISGIRYILASSRELSPKRVTVRGRRRETRIQRGT
jgi:hypothetical protein